MPRLHYRRSMLEIPQSVGAWDLRWSMALWRSGVSSTGSVWRISARLTDFWSDRFHAGARSSTATVTIRTGPVRLRSQALRL